MESKNVQCTDCMAVYPRELEKNHGRVCNELLKLNNQDDNNELSKRGLFRTRCPFCPNDFCYFHSRSEGEYHEFQSSLQQLYHFFCLCSFRITINNSYRYIKCTEQLLPDNWYFYQASVVGWNFYLCIFVLEMILYRRYDIGLFIG